MLLRNLILAAICLATMLGRVTGLTHGMVIVVDNHGNLGIEKANVRHIHDHADGADHAPDDHGADADHANLHAAMATTGETCLEQCGADAQRAVDRLAAAKALPAAFAEHFVAQIPSGEAARSSLHIRGSIARAENARLLTVILLI
jgi:hypothetical protein